MFGTGSELPCVYKVWILDGDRRKGKMDTETLRGRELLACYERAVRPEDGQGFLLCAVAGSVKQRGWVRDEVAADVFPRANRMLHGRLLFDQKPAGQKPRLPAVGDEEVHVLVRLSIKPRATATTATAATATATAATATATAANAAAMVAAPPPISYEWLVALEARVARIEAALMVPVVDEDPLEASDLEKASDLAKASDDSQTLESLLAALPSDDDL